MHIEVLAPGTKECDLAGEQCHKAVTVEERVPCTDRELLGPLGPARPPAPGAGPAQGPRPVDIWRALLKEGVLPPHLTPCHPRAHI